MAFIKISNLTAAGTGLFAGTESFLTELDATAVTQIFGGYGGGGCYEQKSSYNCYEQKSSYNCCEQKSSYNCYEQKSSYDCNYSQKENYNCYPC